ncbi:unnamed protein product [Schistosoma mattheei]|uniref:Uncharacterized protein n=1 Tax=Schistosoma mattheei TaxID=31246 RepID=A0A3P8IIH3_9TREM|nr:unnamed protein product [Schistosoma mattheei]
MEGGNLFCKLRFAKCVGNDFTVLSACVIVTAGISFPITLPSTAHSSAMARSAATQRFITYNFS